MTLIFMTLVINHPLPSAAAANSGRRFAEAKVLREHHVGEHKRTNGMVTCQSIVPVVVYMRMTHEVLSTR